MIFEGVFIPTWEIAILMIGISGCLHSAAEKEWGRFSGFLALGFVAGLVIYFELLNV